MPVTIVTGVIDKSIGIFPPYNGGNIPELLIRTGATCPAGRKLNEGAIPIVEVSINGPTWTF